MFAGGLTQDMEREQVCLTGHHKKVIQVRSTPTAHNLLAATLVEL